MEGLRREDEELVVVIAVGALTVQEVVPYQPMMMMIVQVALEEQ